MEENKKEILKEAIQNIKDRKYAETLGVLDKLAEEGDREAMFWLAERCVHGFHIFNEAPQPRQRFIHIYPDRKKAEQLLQESADLGFPPAQYRIGNKYYHNCLSENRDYDKAFQLFKSAAEQGFVPAIYKLAQCYLHARGTERNYEESMKLLKKAAEACYTRAEYDIAQLYLSGHDVDNNDPGPIEPDLKKVFYWFKRAAEHGQIFAQYKMTVGPLDRHVTARIEQKAIEWLRKAAEKGLTNAMIS